MRSKLAPNKGKKLYIKVDGVTFARFPIRTHVIKPGEDFRAVLEEYASPYLQSGDYIFISEKALAIAQGRAYPIDSIQPSRLAMFLLRFVHKSPYGVGIASPWTMELAIREAGRPRILIAAAASALTKPLGIRGIFYLICGKSVMAIDGPAPYVLPPYNKYAKLGPVRPNRVARELAQALGHPVVVIDANDLGVAILGRSSRTIGRRLAREIFRDNPLGQTRQQTPICLVRRMDQGCGTAGERAAR